MTDSAKSRALIFYCTRLDPEEFDIPGLSSSDEIVREVIAVPCSGRVGMGDLVAGLAAGFDWVVVLSCGEKSCIHRFGCVESKNAFERAKKIAETTGLDKDRLIFIEVDRITGED
jgi:coenzyme F420-reducing hydrogenase delta subunit